MNLVRGIDCTKHKKIAQMAHVYAAANPNPVVVLSRFAEWDHYLAALRAGAFDYIVCPPDPAETERIVRSAIGDRR
jgi:DNA-binding NtrC family response regulator